MQDRRNPLHRHRKHGVAIVCALLLALQLPLELAGCSSPTKPASSLDEQPASSTTRQEDEPAGTESSEPESTKSEPTESEPTDTSHNENQGQSAALLSSPEDIDLHAVDEWGQYYAFTYGDEAFDVYYEPDTWKVYDSYKITNHDDIVTICQALIDEHPIHGRDLESFRDAQDMAYEWEQHNLAYSLLPESSAWRESAQNVDLDPEDQGRTFAQMYASRRNA